MRIKFRLVHPYTTSRLGVLYSLATVSRVVVVSVLGLLIIEETHLSIVPKE